jgi:hypothetical protein
VSAEVSQAPQPTLTISTLNPQEVNMARSSLANSSSNLNLSRRQTELFQQIICVGNKMSKVMDPNHPLPMPADRAKLARKWSHLMVELAKMLL